MSTVTVSVIVSLLPLGRVIANVFVPDAGIPSVTPDMYDVAVVVLLEALMVPEHMVSPEGTYPACVLDAEAEAAAEPPPIAVTEIPLFVLDNVMFVPAILAEGVTVFVPLITAAAAETAKYLSDVAVAVPMLPVSNQPAVVIVDSPVPDA